MVEHGICPEHALVVCRRPRPFHQHGAVDVVRVAGCGRRARRAIRRARRVHVQFMDAHHVARPIHLRESVRTALSLHTRDTLDAAQEVEAVLVEP